LAQWSDPLDPRRSRDPGARKGNMMDRPTTRTEAVASGMRLDPVESPVLPSRRHAMNLCRSALMGPPGQVGGSSGPVLITGDAGSGKSWLWRHLSADLATGTKWIAVDLTPCDEPADFYRLIGHELGLFDPGGAQSTTDRVALVNFLACRLADGERFHLVVEEAHNLSSDLWEEIRVLANRLGRSGGFASIWLVGQTSLGLRFSSRPFAAIEARLAARVHLGPIGVDEAGVLLRQAHPGREWHSDEVEKLHRDASGSPKRLLRLAEPFFESSKDQQFESASEPRSPLKESRSSLEPSLISAPASEMTAEPSEVGRKAMVAPLPLTGPARPPIQVDENMIEVGWSPEDTTPSEAEAQENRTRIGGSPRPDAGEEAVQDHYAALQAWREWSENQARQSARPVELSDDSSEPGDEMDEDEEAELDAFPPSRMDRPKVRAEGEQKFAPFGQLFSKMAQSQEIE